MSSVAKKADITEEDIVVAKNPEVAFWMRVVERLKEEAKDIENSARANRVFLKAAEEELRMLEIEVP